MTRQITRIKHNKYIFYIHQDSIRSVKQYHAYIDHAQHLQAAMGVDCYLLYAQRVRWRKLFGQVTRQTPGGGWMTSLLVKNVITCLQPRKRENGNCHWTKSTANWIMPGGFLHSIPHKIRPPVWFFVSCRFCYITFSGFKAISIFLQSSG